MHVKYLHELMTNKCFDDSEAFAVYFVLSKCMWYLACYSKVLSLQTKEALDRNRPQDEAATKKVPCSFGGSLSGLQWDTASLSLVSESE